MPGPAVYGRRALAGRLRAGHARPLQVRYRCAVISFAFSRSAGGWPGALAAVPEVTPKVAQLPKAPPQKRVTAPSGPMLIVISGVPGRAAMAQAVASSRRAASAAVWGMTASLAMSAPVSAMPVRAAVIVSVAGVPSK